MDDGSPFFRLLAAVGAAAALQASAALVATPSSLDFGAQSRGTTSPPKTLTLQNTGVVTIGITSITAPADFAVTRTCTLVAPSATCQESVTFKPVGDGTRSGTISVASNGGNANATVTGIGERSLVTHYYRSILRRAPDAGGKAYWEEQVAAMEASGANVNEVWYAMAMAFFFSAEYGAFQRDAAGFVTDLYATFFDRAPDGGGMSFWTSQLDQGMPREVVLAGFMFSTEFTTFTQAIFGNNAVRREIDTVFDFYRGLLARLPDAAGMQFWIDRFRAAQCGILGGLGAQAEAISSAFVGGAEYQARQRTDAQFVGDLYNAFMRRGADLAGVRYWIEELTSGRRTRAQVRQAFMTSPEFAQRMAQVGAETCRPTLVSVGETTLNPFGTVVLVAAGLDAAAPITAQFSHSNGYLSSAAVLKASGNGTIVVGVPPYLDPATNRVVAGSVALRLVQGATTLGPVNVSIVGLPQPAEFGLLLGEPSDAYLTFQALLLGRRLGHLQAARIALGSNTMAAEATARARLISVLKARGEVRRVMANNALVIQGGTTAQGNVVVFDRRVLAAMDSLFLANARELAGTLEAGAPGDANAKVAAVASVKALLELIKTGEDAAGVINGLRDGTKDRDIVTIGRAGLGGVHFYLDKIRQAELPDGFLEKVGKGLGIIDIGRSMIDVAYDMGELLIVSSNGNDPAEIARVYANMEKHRLELLTNSTAGLLDLFFLKVVPPDTPGALNIFGYGVTTELALFIQNGSQALMDDTTIGVAGSIKNPFPPNQGFARVRGTVNNLTPHSSIELCCLAGSEIVGVAGEGGSYEMLVPAAVAGASYSNMTLRVRDIVASTTQATFSANLQNLSTASILTLPLFTVPRDCYGEYNACVAPCPVGGFAGIQCVNACLAALNACLGP